MRDGFGISSDHHDLHPQAVQRLDRLARFEPDLVGQGEGADHDAVAGDMQDDRPIRTPGLGYRSFGCADLLEHPRTADTILGAVESGVVADRGDLDADAGVGRDGTRRHLVPHSANDGARLPGDHRLVHVGGTVDDAAVGGHAASGTNNDDIADPQVGGRDVTIASPSTRSA